MHIPAHLTFAFPHLFALRCHHNSTSMTDKVDYTPSAKRQALDPSAANPLTGPKSAGGSQAAKGGASNPLSAAPRAQQPGSAAWSLTPGGAAGLGAAAATPGTAGPPSAFAQRTNVSATVHIRRAGHGTHQPCSTPAIARGPHTSFACSD